MPCFMFKRADQGNLSVELQEDRFWKAGTIRSFTYITNVSALAFEPTLNLFAFGRSSLFKQYH